MREERLIFVVPCVLNTFGNLFVLTAELDVHSRVRRRKPTSSLTYFLTYFSVADGLRTATLVADEYVTASGSAGCQVLGALILFTTLAAWA
jgi:hypothetical protein